MTEINTAYPHSYNNRKTNPPSPHALTFSLKLIKLTEALTECCSGFQEKSKSDSSLQIFTSDGDQKSLFKESTKCLQEVPAEQTYEKFLGDAYLTSIESLHKCPKSKSGKNRRKPLKITHKNIHIKSWRF